MAEMMDERVSRTLYTSVNQGVCVPISASGLKGLQPLWRMTHVGKGSRQIRSVPLEEGLALRVVLRVYAGSVFLLVQCRGPLVGSRLVTREVRSGPRVNAVATSDYLRTGTERGNPTV